MHSALNLTVERARPTPFSLTSGEAREETANRRSDDWRRAADLLKHDLSDRPPGEQATIDRIAAADEPVRRLKGRPAEPKQSRASSEHPQLERAVPLSRADETARDSLDFAPVGGAQALSSGRGVLDDRLAKPHALLGLHRTVTCLMLPRLPAIHIEDGSQLRNNRAPASLGYRVVVAKRRRSRETRRRFVWFAQPTGWK